MGFVAERGYIPGTLQPLCTAFAGLTLLACSQLDPGQLTIPLSAMQLNPNYPVVEGRYRMTEVWSIDLPGPFNRRIEEECLVLWRPGLTIWTIVWGNDGGFGSAGHQLEIIKDEVSPEAFDLEVESSPGLERL